MDRLPVLISIPHGGGWIPLEVEDRLRLSEHDIFYDSDSLTDRIFDFGEEVEALLKASVAKTIIDLNRSPNDRPPQNPDGVIKTMTETGEPVYQHDLFPDESLIQTLMNAYYYPYHQKLDSLANSSKIRIALDCHSMLPHAPTFIKSPGKKRPLVCLSNGGNYSGQPSINGRQLTCPSAVIQQMAECFEEAFEIPQEEVGINYPFSDGYIIRSHFVNRIPWIQVSINKKLYLKMETRKQASFSYTESKVDQVKSNIRTALKLFFLNF